jgi:hypothetical protein
MKELFYGLLISLLLAVSARAQTVEGDWQGTLKGGAEEVRLVLHVTKDEKGGLKATLDMQNVMGVPVTSISFVEPALRFEIQRIGSFEGTIDKERATISGTWTVAPTQGGVSLPLALKRAGATPKEKQAGGSKSP